MPDWIDTAFESRVGILQLKTFLSKNIGLDILDNGELASRQLPVALFKTSQGTDRDQVTAARSIATACARLVAKMTLPEWGGMPNDPAEFREMVVRHSGYGWPDLQSMLKVLWSLGIPVLYLPSLPALGRKMEGMVTFVAGRPVIILTKRAFHPDLMLFLLGHEAGHIAKGHLPMRDGEAIVDDTVGVENEGIDQQEVEANAFSTGIQGDEVNLKQLMRAYELAEAALDHAKKTAMNPGYVILNAIHNTPVGGKRPFALAMAALKQLPDFNEGKSTDVICKEAVHAHIDTERLRDDSIDFLEKLGVL
uniref:ImmA/IrrE family metallo-endopeptidase n=1 Tax=uncultured Rhizobium sp. TaxID=155567 RepID=UPI00261B33B0|nr:ImmA/IrrE family metallo-endopeptidase [uncultured Rhizobium sp.]